MVRACSRYLIRIFLVFGILTSLRGKDFHLYHDIEASLSRTSFFDEESINQSKIAPIVPIQMTNYLEPQSDDSRVLIVIIAADNNLGRFAARNIKQMAAIGSNQNIKIVVQLDIKLSGNKKITRRYFIEKGRIVHLNADDPYTQEMDSGSPETLISLCRYVITHYPAQNYDLVFWNHGTGILDPEYRRIIDPSELFTFNSINRKFELNRSIAFFDFINAMNIKEREDRGICWDDSTGNFLTNQSLDYALATIQNELLHGRKFGVIGFDACLMSMLEIANIIKKYAEIMVASEEVELGFGWDYSEVLAPFEHHTLNSREFGEQIVKAYDRTYKKITNDLTLSAIDLEKTIALEDNLDAIATLLMECLRIQKQGSVKQAIKSSRDRYACTHFSEPSYLDQHHFYTNLLHNLKNFSFTDMVTGTYKVQQLHDKLVQGCRLIEEFVIANSTGSNVTEAKGVSIYFPERRVHNSYRRTTFASTNNWVNFLTQYLAS